MTDAGNQFLKTQDGKDMLQTGTFQTVLSPWLFGACGKGVNMYHFDARTETIKLAWTNVEVSPLTTIPLQTENHVWVLGVTESDPQNIKLISFKADDGTIVVQTPIRLMTNDSSAGIFLSALLNNVVFAGIGTDGDNLVFGTIKGIITATTQN